MKTCIVFTMLFVTSLIMPSCIKDAAKGSKASSSNDGIVIAEEKIDSTFSYYFAVLDTVYGPASYKSGPLDIGKGNTIASIIERLSGIRAKGGKTYGGRLWVNQEYLDQWKAWYRENKSRLRWDTKNNKVVLLKEK